MSDHLSNEGSWSAVLPQDAKRSDGMVYFAFKPGPRTADELVAAGDRLRIKHQLTSRMSRDVLHMSICPIGRCPELTEARIALARKIANRIAARPFEIVLDRARTFPNGKEKAPLVVYASARAPGGELFQQNLILDLKRAGFPIDKRRPAFHATLFYDRNRINAEPIDPIRWEIRDFVLVHSIHGEGRHVELGRWPPSGAIPG